MIRAPAPALKAARTGTKVSATDETNPGLFTQNRNTYPRDVRSLVGRMNVHTYGTGGRTGVRDLAEASDKPLWMSEGEGDTTPAPTSNGESRGDRPSLFVDRTVSVLLRPCVCLPLSGGTSTSAGCRDRGSSGHGGGAGVLDARDEGGDVGDHPLGLFPVDGMARPLVGEQA